VGIDFCFVRVSWVGLGWVGLGLVLGLFCLGNLHSQILGWVSFVGLLVHCIVLEDGWGDR
jgi:hypothetical protein